MVNKFWIFWRIFTSVNLIAMQPDHTTAAPGLAGLMHNLVSSNHWAHKRYVEWLAPKPIALLEQEIPSSFPSIKRTLVHIWATERFWLAVLQKAAYPPWMNDYVGPIEEVFAGLLQQSEAFAHYVHSQNEPALLEERALDTPWAKGSRRQYDFITHCMSHSAYHRGQVVTIGRNLGLEDAPMTDYNAFLMGF
jgi:uncharacterized damage-inducible protein DinB